MTLNPSGGPNEEPLELMKKSFVHMRFRGGRFEGQAAPPLESLNELAKLNDLILLLAPVMWRKLHNKKRIRDGSMPEPPVFRVSGFAEGSSIPLIERDGAADTLFGDPFEMSRDLIEQTFQGIVDENFLLDEFPDDLVNRLRSIGKSFAPDEGAEFLVHQPDGSWSAKNFTAGRREQFWKNFDKVTSSEMTLTGRLNALYRTPGRLVLTTLSGRKIDGKFIDDAIWDDLHEALGSSQKHPYSRLTGTVELDYRGRVTRIQEVKGVEVMQVMSNRWQTRFEELAAMQSPENPSVALVTSDSFERTNELLESLLEADAPMPAIFPSYEGGLNLVWQKELTRTTVYVEPDEPFEVEQVLGVQFAPFSSSSILEITQEVVKLIHG